MENKNEGKDRKYYENLGIDYSKVIPENPSHQVQGSPLSDFPQEPPYREYPTKYEFGKVTPAQKSENLDEA